MDNNTKHKRSTGDRVREAFHQSVQAVELRIREGSHLALIDAPQTLVPPQPSPACDSKELTSAVRALATVATAIWRIRVKLPVDDKAELPSDLRHVPRHIQAAWDALIKAGLKIEDPKGKKYVAGMAVNVAAFQPKPGINTEMIDETLKPSIFYHDTLVQRADVIVATPESDASASPALATETGDDIH